MDDRGPAWPRGLESHHSGFCHRCGVCDCGDDQHGRAEHGRPEDLLPGRCLFESDVLGDLVSDFDFNQAPLPAVILPVHPVTTLTGTRDPPAGLDPAVAAAEAEPLG